MPRKTWQCVARGTLRMFGLYNFAKERGVQSITDPIARAGRPSRPGCTGYWLVCFRDNQEQLPKILTERTVGEILNWKRPNVSISYRPITDGNGKHLHGHVRRKELNWIKTEWTGNMNRVTLGQWVSPQQTSQPCWCQLHKTLFCSNQFPDKQAIKK